LYAVLLAVYPGRLAPPGPSRSVPSASPERRPVVKALTFSLVPPMLQPRAACPWPLTEIDGIQ